MEDDRVWSELNILDREGPPVLQHKSAHALGVQVDEHVGDRAEPIARRGDQISASNILPLVVKLPVIKFGELSVIHVVTWGLENQGRATISAVSANR